MCIYVCIYIYIYVCCSFWQPAWIPIFSHGAHLQSMMVRVAHHLGTAIGSKRELGCLKAAFFAWNGPCCLKVRLQNQIISMNQYQWRWGGGGEPEVGCPIHKHVWEMCCSFWQPAWIPIFSHGAHLQSMMARVAHHLGTAIGSKRELGCLKAAFFAWNGPCCLKVRLQNQIISMNQYQNPQTSVRHKAT